MPAEEVIDIIKTLTSSQITQSGVNLTGVTPAGEYWKLEDLTVQTDSTGLAGGTQFQIASNNAKGAAVIFQETFANLGANITKHLEDQAIGLKFVLEPGKRMQAKATVADGTGAGTIDIFMKFRRLRECERFKAA